MITIDSIILFVDSLLLKYKEELNQQAHAKYVEKLKKIKNKNADDKLYLSVIGEFSTGKSTFINALLRDNLLDAQVLQGTTTINSVIQYGNDLNMIIQKTDSIETENLKSRGYTEETIREQIKSIHACSGNQNTKKVTITHPSDFLSQGIAIIDTPGTNTPELWHEQVTQNAIHELSDTSIILTSASQPVPDSLVDFVQANLKGILNRCIFLVTKIDTIRQRERDEQIEYIKYTIQQKLGVKDPVVVPYSSLLVLEEKTNSEKTYSKNDRENILDMSFETERQIFTYIQENKQVILKDKLSKLLIELLNELEKDLDSRNKTYQQRNDILKANTKRTLEAFFEEEGTKIVQNYIDTDHRHLAKYNDDILEVLKEDIALYYQMLARCNNENDLKNYGNLINKSLDFRKNATVEYLDKVYIEITERANAFVKSFIESLNKEYSGLNALMPNDWDATLPDSKFETNDTQKIEIAVPSFDTTGIEIGGAVAGAAIGAILGGGIGAAAGGWLGRKLASWFGGPNINEVKTQVWQDLHPKIIEQYENLRQLAMKNMITCGETLYNQSLDRLDSYIAEYNEKIDLLIKQDEDEKESLERSKQSIASDKKMIMQYKDFLSVQG